VGRRDRISAALVALAIGAAILALGGATRWAQSIVAAIAAVGVLAQINSRRGQVRWPPLLVLLGVASLWTCIQLIPLPASLVETLMPTLAAYREDGAQLAQVSVASTITMDVPATLRALAFLLTLSGVAFVALRLSSSERGRYLIVASVAACTGFAALLTGLHELLGATSLYGLYKPWQASPPILGPLLNSNHLGGLMAVGTVTSLGLAFYTRQAPLLRVVWWVVAVSCAVVTLASLSRGAVISLVAGLVVTLGAMLAHRMQSIERSSQRRREQFFARTLPVGVVIACSLVIAVYVGAGSAMQQLENTSLDEIREPRSKFAAWRSAMHLVEETPWVGVGRGAFESSFTHVHPASSVVTFSHLENEALQAVVDWGLPATLVFAGLAAWIGLLAIRRWRDGPLAAGALGALMVVAFQSNFDFGMELLGLAVPTTALVATLTYVGIRELRAGVRTRMRITRIAHGAAIALGGLALLSASTRTLEEDHRRLQRTTDPAVIRASIEAHPMDYLGYAALSQEMLRANDEGGVRMLNHALRLHPTHAGLHRLAARLLVRAGRASQAESEYAASIRGSRNPRDTIVEMLAVLPKDRAAGAIPVELNVDVTVRTLTQEGRVDVALLWLERVSASRRDLHSAQVRYSLAMQQHDLVAAEQAGRLRCELDPSTRCRLALAQVLSLAGKHQDVITYLRDVMDWHGHREDRVKAWLLLCDANIALQRVNDAKYCLRRLDASGSDGIHRRARTGARTTRGPSRGPLVTCSAMVGH